MNTPMTLFLSALVAVAAALHGPPTMSAPEHVRASHTSEAGSLLLAGQVVDSLTGRPLPEVVVTIDGVESAALTGRTGRYLLSVPADRASDEVWTVRATLLGYGEALRTVRPSTQVAGVVSVDFQLDGAAVELEQVVVNATGIDAQRRVVARNPAPATGMRADYIGPARESSAARAPGSFAGPLHDREQYARIVENDFRSAVDAPLSTFSIDVDRASYSNIRRFLMGEHRLPPVDAVQIEEMVNYFPYSYDRPHDGQPVGITTELAATPWADDHQLLRVGIAAPSIDTEALPPANLVFLLDVSGSMNAENKLGLVKQSLRLLVNQLRPEDRVSIVVYAGAAGLVLDPTSGAEKATILAALDRLEAGGSTAGGQGLRLAYDVARRTYVEGGNNRVILATDGDFNVGESSDAAMTRLVEQRREEGTFLTILGFGTGNLQATKMQEMAQNGNGNWAYIDGLQEARKVLVGEMGGTLLTVAKDVKIQVEFNPARVRAWRLLGYENRLLADEDFNDDTKDAGEIGAGHTVTALYEVVPVGSASEIRGGVVDPLRYRAPDPIERSEATDELAFVKVRYKDPDGSESRMITEAVGSEPSARASEDFRFASAVAGFGMLLRESEHRGNLHTEQVLDLAGGALGRDPDGYRSEFLDMVRVYRLLTDGRWSEGGMR